MRRPIRQRLLQALTHRLLWSLGALAVGLLLTATAYNASRLRIEAEARSLFNGYFDRIQASITQQFEQTLHGLRGAIGAQASSELNGSLRRNNFRAYVATRNLPSEFPGVRGIGYIERVRRSDLQRFETAERADQAPDFTVTTRGSDEEMYIIKYIEPLAANLSAQGVDVGVESIRREAVERAIHSGTPSLTGSVTLMQDAQQNVGFLYLVPVYAGGKTPPTSAERRVAFTGIFFAALVANDLLAKSANETLGEIDFELDDTLGAASTRRVYSSRAKPMGINEHVASPDFESSRYFQQSRTVFIGGNPLLLRAQSSAAFDARMDWTTPRLVATTGVGLSLLLAYLVWLVLGGRDRARRQAGVLTRDLARMARVVEHTTHLVAMCGTDQKIEWANAAFNRVFGVNQGSTIGLLMEDLFPTNAAHPEQSASLRKALAQRESVRQIMSKTRGEGETLWLDFELQPEHGDDGQFLGYVAIASDITQQEVTNQQLAKALRDAQTLMSAINQHSLVSITDPTGTITYVNDLFSASSGYSQEELIGNNHRLIKSDRQEPGFSAKMWATISSGSVWRGVVCNQTKKGALYWMDTLIAPYLNEFGHIEQYVSIRTDVTAAVLAQQALIEERESLARIIAGTNAGTWSLNAQTEQCEINELWAAMLGYTKQALEPINPQTWRDLCEPDDLRQASVLLTQHMSGEIDHYDAVLRMRHRLGHWVWIQTRGTVTSRTSDGKAQWVSGIHLDISEQRKNAEKLQRANTIMQSILDNIPIGLSAFDSELNLIAKNQLFQTHLDFPDELFLKDGTSFERIIRFNADRGEYGPGDKEPMVQTILERASHPALHLFERIRPNGVALEVRGAPMPGGGFVTTYADISLRKQAEAEIARTTTMLQSILNAATEMSVVTIGADHRITLFNKGAERLLGYTAEEVVGHYTPELIHDAAEVASRAAALSAQLGRDVVGFEVLLDPSMLGKKNEWRYRRKDGSQVPVTLVVTALTDQNGLCTGYLGVSQDISLEKEYQEELHSAKDAAEAATAAKSQFLANMSHEIRTPMNAILGMLTLLQHTTLTPRQLDYAQKTHGAAKSLLGLLNDILDFSKIDAGKMELNLQPFRVDHLMRDLSVILSANVGPKPVEVLFDIDPSLPKALMGDAMRLQQVLINLAGNAIKFTEKGEVLIQLKVLSLTDSDATLRISVRDSGIGISPQNQTRIFDGFSQAEASTTRRFGGTGLGLTISKRFVELMGGHLELESALGQGSDFHFTFTTPVCRNDEANQSPEPRLQSLSVLVVDDNATARQVLRDMAQSWGWQVDMASSGAEALNRVEARTRAHSPAYQVILVDWMMPGMDGWETIARLRQPAPRAAAPIVIMVTAQGREMLSQRSEQEQARLNAFLVKPITASMLFDAVAEAQSGRGNLRTRPRLEVDRTQRLQGMRLLVVEDNVINQQVAQELLRAEGAIVEIADNGQLGVAAIAAATPPFDAVLMDLQMPVMDGYTATRFVRQQLKLLDLPVIAMTANAMASDRAACLAAGMNDHIGKPIDLSDLVNVLNQHTRRTLNNDSDTPLFHPPSPSPNGNHTGADSIDVDGALERLGGNTVLYAKVLQSYLLDVARQPDQLEALLQQGDRQGAHRLLHTLKGLSATVGADGLAAMAKAMELTVSGADAQDTDAEVVVSFREAVALNQPVLSAVVARLTPQAKPGAATAKPVNSALLLANLTDLQVLLQGSDMQALAVHAQLCTTHEGAQDRLNALNKAMNELDFQQSMVQCASLIQALRSENHP